MKEKKIVPKRPGPIFSAVNVALLGRSPEPVEVPIVLLARPYEHSEQARAPHTNGPRDVPRCGALYLLQKTLHYKGG
jgi:hypothetical protein